MNKLNELVAMLTITLIIGVVCATLLEKEWNQSHVRQGYATLSDMVTGK